MSENVSVCNLTRHNELPEDDILNVETCRSMFLYVTLARHNELPEDDLLNVETCRKMLFVIVFDIIVQSLVKLQI